METKTPGVISQHGREQKALAKTTGRRNMFPTSMVLLEFLGFMY